MCAPGRNRDFSVRFVYCIHPSSAFFGTTCMAGLPCAQPQVARLLSATGLRLNDDDEQTIVATSFSCSSALQTATGPFLPLCTSFSGSVWWLDRCQFGRSTRSNKGLQTPSSSSLFLRVGSRALHFLQAGSGDRAVVSDLPSSGNVSGRSAGS